VKVLFLLHLFLCAITTFFSIELARNIFHYVNDTRVFREPHGALVERTSWIAQKLFELAGLLIGQSMAVLLLALLQVFECCRETIWKGKRTESSPSLPRRKSNKNDYNRVYSEVSPVPDGEKLDDDDEDEEDEDEDDDDAGGAGEGGGKEGVLALEIEQPGSEESEEKEVPFKYLNWLSRCIKWLSLGVGLGFFVYGLVIATMTFAPIASSTSWDQSAEHRCNPGSSRCMLPFPSLHLLSQSNETATGWRFDVRDPGVGVYLRTFKFLTFESTRDLDGFSPMSAVVFEMPEAAEVSPYPGNYFSPEESSETILIDTTVNKTIPHFLYKKDGLVYMQPREPFGFDRRIVAGVRQLKNAAGSVISRKPNPALAGEAVVKALESFGWRSDDELQLCWEFHTASCSSTLVPGMELRRFALEKHREGKVRNKVIKAIDERDLCSSDDENQTAYTIHGKIESPSFLPILSNTANHVRDGENYSWTEYTVRVPCSIATNASGNVTIVQYGHGFLGDRSEVLGHYLGELSNLHRWILVAVDTQGLTRHDLLFLLQLCLNQASLAAPLTEMVWESHINRMLSEMILVKELREEVAPILDVLNGSVDVKYAYYGNSLGAITGLSYVSMQETTKRAVLGVGGLPYNLILRFSDQFSFFKTLLRAQFFDSTSVELFALISQSFWDQIGSGWLGCYSQGEDFQCGGAGYDWDHYQNKNFFLQDGVVDDSVPAISGHLVANAVNASVVNPVRGIPLLRNETEARSPNSFLVEWLPERNLHRCLRLQPAAKAQIGNFITNGWITGDECGANSTCVADTSIDSSCDVDIGQ